MNKAEARGKIKITDEGKIREIDITEFVQATYADHRLVTVAKSEENTYVMSIENPESSGRSTYQCMHLSEESMIGVLSTVMIYFSMKGENLGNMLQKSLRKDNVNYNYSDNLEPWEQQKS